VSDRPRFFETPSDFRRWLRANHRKAEELWVGYRKKATGRATITWEESVVEALRYGWIDGVRRRHDDASYKVRFTPRRPGSAWSAVNVRTAEALIAKGKMPKAGLAAYESRDRDASGYAVANRTESWPPGYERRLKANRKAWEYFRSRPPGYRRNACHWVTSAKREETRERRLQQLIADSAAGRTIPPLTRKPG